MKKLILLSIAILFATSYFSQDLNSKKTKKFNEKIVSVYDQKPFTGVRLMKFKKRDFLVCVVELNNGKSNDLDRLAKIKAQRDVSEFINGSNVISASSVVMEESTQSNSKTSDTNISTEATSDYATKMIDNIKSNSEGFVNGIESIEKREKNGKHIYIYIKEIL